jgi:hypothetical protein
MSLIAPTNQVNDRSPGESARAPILPRWLEMGALLASNSIRLLLFVATREWERSDH